MADEPLLGEVILFAGNFAPRGWAICEGQLLPINQNTALFSLLGTTYGGDGRTSFALPDLRGRVPVSAGSGPGLTPIQQGRRAGSETNTLTINTMPAHSHDVAFTMDADPGTTTTPGGVVLAETSEDAYGDGTNPVQTGYTTTNTGSSLPYNHRSPYLGMNYIIAMTGIFPSRS